MSQSARSKAGAAKARAKSGKSRARTLAPNKDRRGLDASDIALAIDDERIAALVAQVRDRGGAPIGAYREPLSGSTAAGGGAAARRRSQPTPFQRDLSPTHAKRLAQKIDEVGSFLDPIIVVRGREGRASGRRTGATAWPPPRCSACGRSRRSSRRTRGSRSGSSRSTPRRRTTSRTGPRGDPHGARAGEARAAAKETRLRRPVRGAGVPDARHRSTRRTARFAAGAYGPSCARSIASPIARWR